MAHWLGPPPARRASSRQECFSRAGVDTAWWTLEAVRAGQPLHRMLGATRDAAEVGAAIGVLGSHASLLERIDEALEAGYRRGCGRIS